MTKMTESGRLTVAAAALGIAFLALAAGCVYSTTATRVSEQGRAAVHEDIPIDQAGAWVETDIRVPAGALVAVLARGELYCDWGGGTDYRYAPWLALKIRVGEGGVKHRPGGGLKYSEPGNTVVFRSLQDGILQFRVNHTSTYPPRFQIASMNATAIVWPAGATPHSEEMRALLQAYAGDFQFNHLPFQAALCYVREGRYEDAKELLSYVDQEIEIVKAYHPGSYLTARYGYCYVAFFNEWSAGHDRKAVELASEARRIAFTDGDPQLKALALVMLGTALARTGNADLAVAMNEEALNLAPHVSTGEFNAPWIRAWAHANLARVNETADRPADAEGHGLKALPWYETWQPWTAAELWVCVGRSRSELGRVHEAKKALENAVVFGSRHTNLHVLMRAYGRLGRLHEGEGDEGQAVDCYARAVDAVERLRVHLTDPAERAGFLEERMHLYDRIIRLLRKRGDQREAFHYVERARARELLDMLADKTFSSSDPALAGLLERYRELVDTMKRSTRAQGGLRGSAGEPDDSASPLARLQEELDGVGGRIRAADPEFASLLEIDPLKAGEIMGLLDADTALVAYFLGEGEPVAFVATRDGVRSVDLPMGVADLEVRVRRFRSGTLEHIDLKALRGTGYRATMAELYDALIRPVEPLVGDRTHLVIVPHRILHYVPFQALCTAPGPEGRFLIQDRAISYLPSAGVLRFARAKNRGERKSLFAAGNPRTDLPPLPAAEREVREVSALYREKRVLTGGQATESAFKAEAPGYDVLLLSTHGEMIEDDPLSSNLRFADSQADDGRLTVSEIFDLDIRANLVTLSACETGLAGGRDGALPKGDDLVGLGRAFIHAGSPSVIASLWKMSDASTVELVTAFYRNLETMDKAEALRQAQLELAGKAIVVGAREDRGGIVDAGDAPSTDTLSCRHPFFWAPFVLIGDWR